MFNYSVYGVAAVSGIQGSQWVQPVDRVREVRPVSRAVQVSTLYNRQAESSFHHQKSRDTGQDFEYKAFVRSTIQSGLSTLNFLGTYQLLGDMSRPAQPEPDFIERYTDQLFTLTDHQSGEEQSDSTRDAACDTQQSPASSEKSSGKSCEGTSGPNLSGAMGNAAATVLS